MAFVIDASVVGCWAFDVEHHPIASDARERIRHEEAHAPSLWWYEVRNTLLVSERRGRIAEAAVADFLRSLAQLPIRIDIQPVEPKLMDVARRHRLSVYDAAYLELAARLDMPLLTLDSSLARAAVAAGVRPAL
jgi:predicted nucleic acid-binding protein